MKLLHTSDWHLGKHLSNFSRHAEQLEVMDEICRIAENEKVDAVIVAGDLFDTFNPPAEAIDLFYKTLKRLSGNGTRPVIAIAGNHDSPERIEAPDPLGRACGIVFSGYPHTHVQPFVLENGPHIAHSEAGFIELRLPHCPHPLRILLTPYANELRMKKYLGNEDAEQELRELLQESWTTLANKHCDQQGVNILLSHLMLIHQGEALPEEPEDEKPILHVGGAQAIYTCNVPSQIQYVALGHLHRMQKMQHHDTLHCYSGSPLSYSFSEAGQQKYVVIAELQPGQPALINPIALQKGKPLLRMRFDDLELAVQWLHENPDTLLELTIASDTYLTSEQRRRLSNAHDGIISIIPEVNLAGGDAPPGIQPIDLKKDMEALFKDYFIHVKGSEPNDRLMDLFKEILAQEDPA